MGAMRIDKFYIPLWEEDAIEPHRPHYESEKSLTAYPKPPWENLHAIRLPRPFTITPRSLELYTSYSDRPTLFSSGSRSSAACLLKLLLPFDRIITALKAQSGWEAGWRVEGLWAWEPVYAWKIREASWVGSAEFDFQLEGRSGLQMEPIEALGRQCTALVSLTRLELLFSLNPGQIRSRFT